VYVPRSIGPLTAVNGLLPRPARDALRKGLKVDHALEQADPRARRGYELRAGLAEPHLGAGDGRAQLPAGD
jgi:hypothetical protein